MYKPYKVEMVDFCRPMDWIDAEIKELEKEGFIPVEQIDYYLCFANPTAKENLPYKEQILKDSREHLKLCEAAWKAIEEMMKR